MKSGRTAILPGKLARWYHRQTAQENPVKLTLRARINFGSSEVN
jgi:hypothetical protein